MSDYHILEIQDRVNRIRLILHFTVPAGNNEVNIPYSDCVKQFFESQFPDRIIRSAVPWDIGTELQELQAGLKIEYDHIILIPFGVSPSERQQRVISYYNNLESTIDPLIQNRFKYWGYNGNVL